MITTMTAITSSTILVNVIPALQHVLSLIRSSGYRAALPARMLAKLSSENRSRP
ncbi:MAG: hypothetical protein IMZ65_02900 [Planctomycetes bacterium]|nr:hypothetical protein [Planctomycetota bacterium]